MNELVEFLLDRCKEELKEENLKGVDPRLKKELESIRRVLKLGEGKISSSTLVKMKDELYDLISTLTDITISHTHKRRAQNFCFRLQIGSRSNTKNSLRNIRTRIEKKLGPGQGTTDGSRHGKENEEDGLIRKIMTALKRLLPQRTATNNSPIQKGEDGAGPDPPDERTGDNSSNKKKCSGPETLPDIKGKTIPGFDKKVDEIELCLNVQNRGGHIEIGIVGMCGSGKTTLAHLVYNRVVKEFKRRIWVSLLPHQLTSNDTDFEQILREILRQCGQDEGDKGGSDEGDKGGSDEGDKGGSDEGDKGGSNKGDKGGSDKGDKGGDPAQRGSGKQQLLRIIRNLLLGESYLLVLDGVWDADMDWYFELGRALDWHYKDGDVGNDASKSAVIITTRLEEAAKTMVGISALHHIHPYLTPDICWDIFNNQVEQGGEINRDNARLLELKNDVEEQCDGLPLAAVTLAKIIPELIGQQGEPSAAA